MQVASRQKELFAKSVKTIKVMSKLKIKIKYRDKKCNKVLQKGIEGQKLNPLRTMSEGEKMKKNKSGKE